MAEELVALPGALCVLSTHHAAVAGSLTDAWTAGRASTNVGAGAFGNAASGPEVAGELTGTVEAAESAMSQLAAVHEVDADLLLGWAFDVSATDEDVAERYRTS